MARQEGIQPITGTIDNMTFYKSRDGYMVKKKTTLTGERIATDDAFQRTRENNYEFGRAGKGGKVLRVAVRNSISKTKDNRMVSRLTAKMLLVVQADATSDRGERNVIDGEAGLLAGFDFNVNSKLSSTLFAPYVVSFDRVKGLMEITVADFIPLNMAVAPEGTTHFQLFSAVASVDFEKESFDVDSALTGELAYDSTPTGPITLKSSIPGESKHPVFILLGIEFMQQVNGKYYKLKNGAYNACAIVNVDSPVLEKLRQAGE